MAIFILCFTVTYNHSFWCSDYTHFPKGASSSWFFGLWGLACCVVICLFIFWTEPQSRGSGAEETVCFLWLRWLSPGMQCCPSPLCAQERSAQWVQDIRLAGLCFLFLDWIRFGVVSASQNELGSFLLGKLLSLLPLMLYLPLFCFSFGWFLIFVGSMICPLTTLSMSFSLSVFSSPLYPAACC